MNSTSNFAFDTAAGIWEPGAALKDFDRPNPFNSYISPPISRETSRSVSGSPGWNMNPSAAVGATPISRRSWSMNRNTSADLSSQGTAKPNGSDTTALEDFWTRYHQVQSVDHFRNNLIEDLLNRYESLNEQYRKRCEESERAREYATHREPKYKENLLRLQMLMDRDPFVLILLDGNCMLFQDETIGNGDAGGREAAEMLHQAILACIQTQHPDFPADTKIVVRVYADFRCLGETFRKIGVIGKASQFFDFAKGFTRSKHLFDFVDVGDGTEATVQKVTEVFKLHIYDYHCRQVFFGGSHDSQYISLLNYFSTDHSALGRVTLLQGRPFNEDVLALSYPKRTLGNLFRTSIINVSEDASSSSFGTPLGSLPNGSSGIPSRPISRTDSETFPKMPIARAASISTDSSNPKPSPALTWASAVQKPAETTPLQSLAKPTSAVASKDTATNFPLTWEQISRNRNAQRIDPIITHDKEEVDRVKRLKLCNVHFLRHQCPYGDSCSHDHRYRPSQKELRTLSLVARMAPCNKGTECDDPKCLYGHHCMAPEGRDPNKLCIFGDGCKFPRELHHIDRNPVRTVKV